MTNVFDNSNRTSNNAQVGVTLDAHDAIQWRAQWMLRKFHAHDIAAAGLDPETANEAAILTAGVAPYETLEREGNLLMNGGISCLFQCLIGNGTSTAGQNLTYFNNAQAAIGVGDSNTAAAATQTDLQAATNKVRKAMDATFPAHTDGTTSGAASIVFKSTFTTSDANWAWLEWGVFNSASAATGRMLNRKQENLGTKTSAGTWVLTVTITLS